MKFSSLNRFFLTLSIIAVTVGIVTGFWLLGSPRLQRNLKADEQRIKDLHEIAEYLHEQEVKSRNLNQTFQLPKSLPDADYRSDPISGKVYEYKIINSTNYQVCAEFETNRQQDKKRESSYRKLNEFWQHPQGKHCFELDATNVPPDLYNYN